jgi:hypothetical protein
MANRNKHGDDLFDLLRARGVRKRLAKPVAQLEGNSRRNGTKGETLAQQAAEDLDAAAAEIRKRVLRTDAARSRGARKAARTRARKATKRQASARKGAQTRRTVARARSRSRAR